MKCVALRSCQAVLPTGKARYFDRGEVYDFPECPTHFRPLEGDDAAPVSFDTAGEQELLEAEYDLDALKQYIEDRYGKKPGNRGKEKTVEMLIDCRYREIDGMDI